MSTEALAAHALWWPPAKIAGRHLAPALGEIDVTREIERGGVAVDIELPPNHHLAELSPEGHEM